MMIWNDVSDIKKDLKVLMAQSNIDKTRIDNLEKQLDRLQEHTDGASVPMNGDQPDDRKLVYYEFILDLPRKRYEEDPRKQPNRHA
jgi:hypothetical protein